MHHVGEPAVAAVAENNNLIYSLSTMGTTSPSELAQAVPGARRWFLTGLSAGYSHRSVAFLMTLAAGGHRLTVG